MFYKISAPTAKGARLVGGGIASARRSDGIALVSGGIDSGPLALRGFGAFGDDTSTTDGGSATTTSSDNTGTSSLPSWLTNLISAGTTAVQSAQTISNAQQINQINIQRAAQGLPPINPTLTGPQVNVGLSAQTQSLLLYGALAVGGLILLNTLLKRV